MAVLSWVDICNMALALIGGGPINSLDETSMEARACKKFMVQVRRSVLSSHAWNCATQWNVPPSIGESGKNGAPAWPYRYAFALPNNCLSVVRIETGLPAGSLATVSAPAMPFLVAAHEGQRAILCNESAPTIMYIADIDDASALDAKVVDVVVFRLASALALPIGEKTQRADYFMGLYREALREAMTEDAQNGLEFVPRDDTYIRDRVRTGDSWAFDPIHDRAVLP